MIGIEINRDQLLEGIIHSLQLRLRASRSRLVEDGEITQQVRSQVRSIVDCTLNILFEQSVPPQSAVGKQLSRESSQIGRSRAHQEVHPADSLEAASVLFDVALPELTRRLQIGTAHPELMAVARALHLSIMAHVAPAAVGYVNALLDKLAAAQHEERLRTSRDLHDRIAHGIASALQRIALSRAHERRDEEKRSDFLDNSESILRLALEDTRELALELRQTVGDRLLDDAVRDYVGDAAQSSQVRRVTSRGLPRKMAIGVTEESFLIIREALRNALSHAEATQVLVEFEWDTDSVSVEVSDDGIGFQRNSIPSGAMGLLAMQERADVIGGELSINGGRGKGTTVRLVVPRSDPLA